MENMAQDSHTKLHIRQATPGDQAALVALHNEAFGPGRFVRSSYRIRETGRTVPELSLVAIIDDVLAGSLHLTPITIGGQSGALLLGPLVIAPAYKSRRAGLSLMEEGIEAATRLGYQLIILVGDLPYFRRAGFAPVPHGRIRLPGPVDPARLLYRELSQDALDHFSGLATAER